MPSKKKLETIEPKTIRISNEKRILYVRESAAQSIVADIFTFGILIAIAHLNFTQWGGRWYMNIFVVFLWLVFVMGRARSRTTEFNSRSDLVDHLIKELEDEGEGSK